MIFTIHFGVPLFLETPINMTIQAAHLLITNDATIQGTQIRSIKRLELPSNIATEGSSELFTSKDKAFCRIWCG